MINLGLLVPNKAMTDNKSPSITMEQKPTLGKAPHCSIQVVNLLITHPLAASSTKTNNTARGAL